MKYVIIGNSAAAVGCIEGIRSVDSLGEITLVSSEKYHTYSRPLISYLLCGKTDMNRMKYRGEDFYTENKVNFLPGETAVAIKPNSNSVVLGDNKVLQYDKLLVATGSSPFVPKIKGLDTVKNVFTFMSLDDALALEKSLKKSSRVLIVGAGLIGLKCAEGIYGRCKSITVVDLANRVMPSVLDEEASKIVKAHIEKKGIEFILSDSVEEFAPGTATLKSGKTLDFDIVVMAVGVRPNLSLVADCGGKINRGIVTDSRSATSIEGIYAAGDCAESYDISTGENKILALLPNAYLQGETAGVNMAGGDKVFDKAMPMNSIGFFGLHIITAGCLEGDSYTETNGDSYKRLCTKDGILKGYILVGDVARAGIYTSVIREKMPLGSLDFESLKAEPAMAHMSESWRKLKLSGIQSEVCD